MQIEAIKSVLAFPMSLHMAWEKADADGKIDASDIQFIMDPVMKLVPAIQNAKEALVQFKDLDDQEKMELNTWAKTTYDIADDSLEEKVEAGIAVMISVGVLIGKLTKEEAQQLDPAQPTA